MASLNPQNDLVFDIQEASYGYDLRLPALDRVSLTVKPGERLAVIGSNGSGKSTLLKLMDGLYFPASGSVTAFGTPLSESVFTEDQFNFEFRRKVGLVFQDSESQLFMPSVWEEIAFAPLQLGFERQEIIERAEWAMKTLQIEKLRDRAPHQLSGGEKKRVALASVLSLSPDVWLLDEPTAGLDPRTASWLMDFIDAQAREGKTIVIATHDLGIVEKNTDRAYVLNENHQVEAEGTSRLILADITLLHESNLL
jgi:cobalt/nickel transport system ATP-binding protein